MATTKTKTSKTTTILRTSIHTFLKNYNYFTTTSFIAIPFSISILLFSSLDSTPLQHTIHFRLLSLFASAGFPVSTKFFALFTLKLSQTITTSTLILPFTFSSLLITKTLIIKTLNTHNKPFSGILNSLLQTQLCNSFLMLSANSTCFWATFVALNFFQGLSVLASSTLILMGGIVYSIVVANAMVVCNMALVLSGMESSGGFFSIVMACGMIKSRTSTALSLAVCANVVMAGMEALFQFRVVSAYMNSKTSVLSGWMVLEGLLIGYMYSIVVTLDTINGCVFYKRCKVEGFKHGVDQEAGRRDGWCLEVKEEEEEEVY